MEFKPRYLKEIKPAQGTATTTTSPQFPPVEQPQEQPQLQPEQRGFFSSMINDAYENLIARPATRFGQALAAPIVYGASALTGNKQYVENYKRELGKDTPVPNGILPGGPVNVQAQKGFGEGATEQMFGEGLKTASYLAPGSRAANPIIRSAVTGARSGAMYGAGDAAAQGGDVGEVLGGAAMGGTTGAVTGAAISSVGPVSKFIKNTVGTTGKFITSQSTGLDRGTIETLIKNPKKITPEVMATLDRDALGTKVNEGIQARLEKLSETGAEYQPIRDQRTPVNIPSEKVPVVTGFGPDGQPQMAMKDVNSIFMTVMRKFGLELDPASGVLRTTPDSVPLAPGDIAALQNFYKDYGQHVELTSNSFLNARKALDILADYGRDANKTEISDVIARQIRSAYDEVGKVQIPGLAKLDGKFSPERKLLGQIRKDYLNGDGTLKDNALNKIANLGQKGKSAVLKRLEKIVPGISEDVNILRAIEDIKDSSGIKIGTYARGGISGLVLGGGNPWAALAGVIIANPSVAVPIIRTYALSRNIAAPVIDRIINNIKKGKPLSEPVKRLIYASFADLVTGETKAAKEEKEEKEGKDNNTEDYLKSLGI